MARRLSRRQLLGAAGLSLFARPSFAAPQAAPARSVFPVALKQEPPYEKLRPLIPPGSDQFECEARAEEILAALDRMVETAEPPPITADFQGRSPMASGWDEVSTDAAFARFDSDGDFLEGLSQWLKDLDSARFYPLEDGLVRFEIRRGRSFHVGHWRLGWAEGRLTEWEPVDETRARLRPALQHGNVLDPDSPEAKQLAAGVPEWRSRLDLASGIDVYGQNGIAAGDVDNDGFDEIYVCQPGGLPNRLLKRGDDGLFRDISAAAGVDLLDHTSSALFVDFRNRGLQDLVVLSGSQPFFFENQGDGTFAIQPGVFRFAEPPRGAFTGMAAADYDGDGYVDLYLCTYIYFQSEDQYSYPSPYHDARNGPPNFLFRNRLADGGFFEDVTARVGLDENNDRYSFAPAWCDYDFDGRPELYVANDFGRNNLYKFDGVRFRDVAAEAGVEDLGPGMSAAWFDADADGLPDLYVTNMWTAAGRRVTHDPAFSLVVDQGLAEEYRRHTKGNSLYRNKGDGTFDETRQAEMGRWAWTGDAFDFDADGVPEIVVAAGMISEPDSRQTDLMSFFWRQVVAHSSADGSPSAKYEEGWNAVNQFIREGHSWNGWEPNVFYKRRGGRWVDFSPEIGDEPRDTRAFAALDLTGDGRLDLVLKNRLAPQVETLLNRAPAPNVIVLELEGVESNRDAIGAWVTARSENGLTSQLVSAGSGYLCQHTKRVHLGLGDQVAAEEVVVRWPSGRAETLKDLRAGRRYRVVEGKGIASSTPLVPNRTPDTAPLEPKRFALRTPRAAWLLEPVPLPEEIPGPGLLLLTEGEVDAPLGVAPVEAVRLDQSPPDRAAWYAIFQRYLFDYRGPLSLPAAFLVDERSRVHKVYARVPQAAELRADLSAMNGSDRASLALPHGGRYAGGVPNRNYFRHGAAFYQAGYPEQALPYLEAVLEKAPENFKALLAVGRIHLHFERVAAARTHLEEAVRVKPDSPEAWNDLGGLAMLEEDYRAAERLFDKALALAPKSTYALANAAQAATRLGRIDEAEQLFRRTLELTPGDADASNQLGLLYAKQERFDEAKALFQQAIENDRAHVPAINNLAVLYLRLNQPSEAIAALRYGIRAAPRAEESYMNLARVYVQSGDREQARAVLQQLLDAVPGSAAALRGLEELSRR